MHVNSPILTSAVNSLKRRLGIALTSLGFDPRKTYRSAQFFFGYFGDLTRFKRLSQSADAPSFALRLLPTLAEKYADSGVASGHYFHQDLWAARLVREKAPARHVDVGSRIDGFIAHLLCFRDVEVLDIRRLDSRIRGLRFHQADLMSQLPPDIEPSDSVSCLHALEHFGLGRYGDPLNPEGWRIGLSNLARLVRNGGHLYLGVPIGSPAVEFNAQRIFDPRYILDEARVLGLHLTQFAHVDDRGDLHEAATPPTREALGEFAKLDYGCGLFVFEKPSTVDASH